MAKRKDFNKGLVKGQVTKCDLVDMKTGGKFLAMDINTGDGNKVKVTFFNTKNNPSKCADIIKEFPSGSKVEISGNVNEREFEGKTGKKGIDRSLSGNSIKALAEDKKMGATFILQGIVKKVKETSEGSIVTVEIDSSYEKEDKTKVERFDTFTLVADSKVTDIMDDLDVEKGCNAKFKGLMLNKLEFDDYGDIVANVQMFKVEKVEEVVSADDIEEQEEVSFL